MDVLVIIDVDDDSLLRLCHVSIGLPITIRPQSVLRTEEGRRDLRGDEGSGKCGPDLETDRVGPQFHSSSSTPSFSQNTSCVAQLPSNDGQQPVQLYPIRVKEITRNRLRIDRRMGFHVP